MRVIDGDKLSLELRVIAEMERATGQEDIAQVFEKMADLVDKQPEVVIEK